jgi:hypothetical protein
MKAGSTRSSLLALGALSLTLFGVVRPAGAQVSLPPAGTGLLTLAVQRIDHTGHRVTDGTLFVNGRSLNVSIYVQFDYSLTDRLAFSAGLPYVFGRYTDPNPPPPSFHFFRSISVAAGTAGHRTWSSPPATTSSTAASA